MRQDALETGPNSNRQGLLALAGASGFTKAKKGGGGRRDGKSLSSTSLFAFSNLLSLGS